MFVKRAYEEMRRIPVAPLLGVCPWKGEGARFCSQFYKTNMSHDPVAYFPLSPMSNLRYRISLSY